MTLREFIEELTELAKDEDAGMEIEVVTVNQEWGGTHTPMISLQLCVDGVRRICVN